MAISVVCPSCQARLSAPDSLAGKRVKCSKCQAALDIRQAAAAGAVPLAQSSTPVAGPHSSTAPTVAAPTPPSPHAPNVDKKQSALPVVLIVVAVAAVLGVLAVVAIGAAAFFLLKSSGSGATIVASDSPTAVVGSATAGAPAAPAAPAAPTAPFALAANGPATVAAPSEASHSPTASSENNVPSVESPATSKTWVVHESPELGFQIEFPTTPVVSDPVGAAAAEDADESPEMKLAKELVRSMAKSSKMATFTAQDGERIYSLTAAPLVLGGMPSETYLERIGANITAINPGFSVEDSESGELRRRPYRAFHLKSGDQHKLVRMQIGSGYVYSLAVEGAGLSFDDADSKRFFDSLLISRPARVSEPPKVAEENVEEDGDGVGDVAPMPNDEPSEEPVGELAGELVGEEFVGRKIPFSIRFPGGSPEKIDTLSAIVDRKRRATTLNLWKKEGVDYESFIASANDRRFVVTAWQEGSLTGSDAANAQLARFKAMLADMLGKNRPQSAGFPNKSEDPDRPEITRHVYSRWLKLESGKKVVYQEIRAGEFSFLLQVEGPSEMGVRDDALTWGFFRSLKLPREDGATAN